MARLAKFLSILRNEVRRLVVKTTATQVAFPI